MSVKYIILMVLYSFIDIFDIRKIYIRKYFKFFFTDEAVLKSLKELGPSGVDVELRSLAPEAGGSVDLMLQFMVFIDYVFSSNRDFELAQSYLGLFLKVNRFP